MYPVAYPTTAQKPVGVRKRNRQQLSCNHCRIRRLKCSRTQPCDSCHRTGDADTCVYAPRNGPRSNGNSNGHRNEETLAARVSRLEKMLLAVDSSDSTTISPSAGDVAICSPRSTPTSGSSESQSGCGHNSTVNDVTTGLGTINFDRKENQTIFVGSSHWTSIISEVSELRNRLMDDELEQVALKNRALVREVQAPSSLLRGMAPRASQEYLLSCLPPRTVADVFVDRFFDSYSKTLSAIHEPTFRKEYAEHWADPSRTKVIWLGLLAVILHCADVAYEEAGQESPLHPLGPTMDFKSLAVQCLIASDYTNPVAYTVETLTLYVQFDEITSPDRSIETPLILGIVIRLAMRMGIHRNAKVNEGLTPFQDEMRRRLWGTIVGLDALHSLQLSLPSAIGKLDWDRAMPRNIHSTEFGPESTELPPSRPLTEHTEATYVIVKDRLLLELKDIMALTTNNEELSANEVGQCERSLAQAYATMPDCLRWSPPSEPNPQWSLIKSHVVAFDRVYQLCKCMLYRKFLRQAQTNTSVNQYRLMCVDAALKLLNHQTTLFFHLKPMFCPSINKRHKFTHPTLDFFVAGMVIALDLYHTEETEASTASYPSPLSDVDPGRRAEMITALETSIQFWAQLKDFSTEAAKAYSVFSYVLQKVQGRQMHLDNSLKNETEHASNDMGMECTDVIGDAVPDKFGFDWASWDAYDVNSMDLEFLQWPATTDII